MRRFLLVCSLIASATVSLLILAVTRPLLMALQADRRERNLVDLARERWPDAVPYDDDDPGVDVDACPACGAPDAPDPGNEYASCGWCR